MKLVLIGIQGSGKSTQGNLLSKQLKLPYLSTGHILGKLQRKDTIRRYIKETINPDFLFRTKTTEIVNSYLTRPNIKGIYLGWFPEP